MKKFLFATLAVLSLTVGTAAFTAPANAYSFALPNQNNDGGGN